MNHLRNLFQLKTYTSEKNTTYWKYINSWISEYSKERKEEIEKLFSFMWTKMKQFKQHCLLCLLLISRGWTKKNSTKVIFPFLLHNSNSQGCKTNFVLGINISTIGKAEICCLHYPCFPRDIGKVYFKKSNKSQ
jgi:hypothetical protein